MQKVRIFGRLTGALALGASICTLTLGAMAGTANAMCFTVSVPYSAPHIGLQTIVGSVAQAPILLPNTCYFSDTAPVDGFDCQLTDPALPPVAPAVWKAASQGTLTVGATVVSFFNTVVAPVQANILINPPGCPAVVPPVGLPNEGPLGLVGQSKKQVTVAGSGPVRLRVQDNMPVPGTSIFLAWY